MANQILGNPSRVLDLNGYTVPGAKMTVYQAGTSTLLAVFSDVDGTIAAANPIIADADGILPQRYVNEPAKVVITTADDATLYTLDPAPLVQSTGAGASQISFEPTVGLPFSNVQAAIEGAAAASAAGFAAFGIGITGNATLLANLDATNIGAGIYRFDGTTIGTFPSGVVAADTGLIETWRQASGVAMMELGHGTTDRVFRRRLAAGVWGTWREEIIANQGAVEGDILYRGASAWTRLAKGTAAQVLRMNSGATAPEWVTPSSGWTLIGSQSITSDATGLITGLSAYRDLLIVGDNVDQVTSGSLRLRIGPTSGVLSTSVYKLIGGASEASALLSDGTSGQRGFSVEINNWNTTDAFKPIRTLGRDTSSINTAIGIASAAVMDRFQVDSTGGVNNVNSGTLYWFGR